MGLGFGLPLGLGLRLGLGLTLPLTLGLRAGRRYLAMNSSSVRQPSSPRMYEATSCASAMFLMMR